MTTAQVVLTEEEAEPLQTLSRSRGQAPEELLHEAIALFLQQRIHGRLTTLRQARGLWQGREDTPVFEKLRDEWNRNLY